MLNNLNSSIDRQVNRTKVKVCGMTRVDDARAAVELGVDAIGVILHADSPRLASIEQARAMRTEIPAFIEMVGVFVDCDPEQINYLIAETGIDLVQLHGDETNQQGVTLNAPFIKAIRARNSVNVSRAINEYPAARALLLDPYVKGQHGGTGKQLSAELWPRDANKKMILAGGLSPSNVLAMVQQLKPYAVDLNSGVETAPGRKNSDLLDQALRALGR